VQGESNACIDAETLAAWANGGLRPAEAVTVEQHLSECDRCTAMLATFVRTTPTAPVVESLWHRWRLPWLVPIATAATALALWIAVPGNQTQSESETFATARQEKAAQAREETPAQPTPPEQVEARAKKVEAKEATPAPPPAIGALEKREGTARPESQIARADEAERRTRELAEPLQVPQAPAKAVEADQRAADAQAPGRLASAPPSPPAPTAEVAAPSSAAGRAAASPIPSERNTQTLARAVAAPTTVISSNPANRWRIVGGSQVERSTNAGRQWERVTIPSIVTLTAGTSPAPTVCWLVGRAGAVYLTTDGMRFTRIAFPEAIDLTAVQATDDRHATVISIDGRTFRTDDQGATWTRATP
jgi:hypothetical protein